MCKTCTSCGQELPLDEFYKKSSNTGGYRNVCKKCDNNRRNLQKQHMKELKKQKDLENPLDQTNYDSLIKKFDKDRDKLSLEQQNEKLTSILESNDSLLKAKTESQNTSTITFDHFNSLICTACGEVLPSNTFVNTQCVACHLTNKSPKQKINLLFPIAKCCHCSSIIHKQLLLDAEGKPKDKVCTACYIDLNKPLENTPTIGQHCPCCQNFRNQKGFTDNICMNCGFLRGHLTKKYQKAQVMNNIVNNLDKYDIPGLAKIIHQVRYVYSLTRPAPKESPYEPIYHEDDTFTTTRGYLYILTEREFIKQKRHIYKIGFTDQYNMFDRFKQYPKNSKLRYCVETSYARLKETKLKHYLNELVESKKIIHRKDIGDEYFEGDETTVKLLTRIINSIVN
jgi:hypothetical protein